MVSKRALRGTEPLGYVPPPGPLICSLCDRPLEPGPGVMNITWCRAARVNTRHLTVRPELGLS